MVFYIYIKQKKKLLERRKGNITHSHAPTNSYLYFILFFIFKNEIFSYCILLKSRNYHLSKLKQ